MNLADISAREAARNGPAVALVEIATGRRLTFAQLEARVDAFARSLAADPRLGRGSRIAMLAYNCAEYVEAYLAAARAGLIVQGLNWRLAADELERIVRDAGSRMLIADTQHGEIAEELQRRSAVDVSLTFGAASDGSYEDYLAAGKLAEPVAGTPKMDEPVMIIYTGGSTGEPKGAVHTHRSCIGAMVNNTVAERILPSDRYLMLGQMFHSSSILALNYLSHGATLVLVPRFEPRTALEVIEAERVTASLAFPPMINYMLREADGRRLDLASLRNVQYGGGPIASRVIVEMMELLGCGVIQCYGSTEHVAVTFLSQEDHVRGLADPAVLRSCGREAYLTEVRLVGPGGVQVPRDAVTAGEIVVRSPANMTGYWNRPDLGGPADGWLPTGDLATCDAAGYFTIVGRVKDLIVCGGENIYPTQVENAIGGHPAVLESAVIGVPDAAWGESVTAFVVLKSGRTATAEEIAGQVRRTLGSYQKPREVRFVNDLPRTSAGKIAKHLLADRPAAIAPGQRLNEPTARA